MDLYDALKTGTTPEELLKTFHQELDEAKTRIAEEKKDHLEEHRQWLAEAILEYLEALFDKERGDYLEIIDLIIEILKEFEKEVMKQNATPSWKTNEILKKVVSENKIITIDVDDKIISDFLKSLK